MAPIEISNISTHPQYGDLVLVQPHRPFEPFRVIQREHHQGQFIFTVKSRAGDLYQLPLQALEYYPCIGDVVVVVAKPYCDWLVLQLQQLKGVNTASARKRRWVLRAELEDLWWTINEFVLQRIKEGEIAVIQANSMQRELPLSCLGVLRKARQRDRLVRRVL